MKVTTGFAFANVIIAPFIFGLLLSVDAEAAQVQSALGANKIGISTQQLLSSTLSTNITLPTSGNKPTTMGTVVAGIHLGTNTDLFAVGTKSGSSVNASEFWVRYTLDASSNEFHQYQSSEYDPVQTSSSPISGSLWLSFNTTTQTFKAYSEQLSKPNLFESGSQFLPYDNQAAISALFNAGPGFSGLPYPGPYAGTNSSINLLSFCIECDHESSLNLAFLELRWNGTGYGLFTSAQGFDQVFLSTDTFSPYAEINSYALNIAPVPLPGAIWLFSSGLLGLVATRRRKSTPV